MLSKIVNLIPNAHQMFYFKSSCPTNLAFPWTSDSITLNHPLPKLKFFFRTSDLITSNHPFPLSLDPINYNFLNFRFDHLKLPSPSRMCPVTLNNFWTSNLVTSYHPPILLPNSEAQKIFGLEIQSPQIPPSSPLPPPPPPTHTPQQKFATSQEKKFT